jgi:hypothetical protein
MTQEEFRSALTAGVNKMIAALSRDGGLLDLTRVRLVTGTTFSLEADVDNPAPLAPMLPEVFRALAIQGINDRMVLLPLNVDQLDLTGVQISYYTNTTIIVTP